MSVNLPAPELTTKVKVRAKVRNTNKVRIKIRDWVGFRVRAKIRVSVNNNNLDTGELTEVRDKVADLSWTQIIKVGDVICVADFHDLCPRLSQQGSFGESRKVGVMEFGLKWELALSKVKYYHHITTCTSYLNEY